MPREMSASEFLDRLESRQLIPAAPLAILRQQVAESEGPIRATTVAKRLVDAGHLTAFQARRLILEYSLELEQHDQPGDAGATPAATEPQLDDDDSDLDFAPLDDDPKRPAAKPPATPSSPPEPAVIAEQVEPVPPVDAPQPPGESAEPIMLSPDDENLVVLDEGSSPAEPLDAALTPLHEDPLLFGASPPTAPPSGAPRRRVMQPSSSAPTAAKTLPSARLKNVWDTPPR